MVTLYYKFLSKPKMTDYFSQFLSLSKIDKYKIVSGAYFKITSSARHF